MLGNARHQLDERNRFRIPVKFREGLGSNPYYLPGKNGCLYIVPEERFEEMFAPFINQNLHVGHGRIYLDGVLVQRTARRGRTGQSFS